MSCNCHKRLSNGYPAGILKGSIAGKPRRSSKWRIILITIVLSLLAFSIIKAFSYPAEDSGHKYHTKSSHLARSYATSSIYKHPKNNKDGLSQGRILTASWYSVESLKKEGTWKHSKGVMANGTYFNEDNFTCATRIFPLGTMLKIINPAKRGGHNSVIVKVTDRIGKRFAKTRIDLSKRAFSQIADLKQGLIQVKVERLAKGE